MFAALVGKTGIVAQSQVYRGRAETSALEAELKKRLQNLKVAAAIYSYQPVEAILSGTLVFSASEKPHVRILLNQDLNELKTAADFIAPQPVIGGDSLFTGLHYPGGIAVPVTAVVDLRLLVDAQGGLRDLQVLNEDPPLLNFGAAAIKDFTGAKFIPAFRDGDPVEAHVIMPICYEASGLAAATP